MSHAATADEGRTTTETSLRSSKLPLSTGVLPFLGFLWALATLVLGVVAVREALVYAGVVDERPWSLQALEALDGQSADNTVLAVAIGCVLIGLLLLFLALRRRTSKHLDVRATTGVYVSTAGVQRLTQSTAADVDGVDSTSVSVSRRRAKVEVAALGDPATTQAAVHEAVTRRLSALTEPPSVRVDVRDVGGGA